ARRDVIAPELEHELRVQVLPDVRILEPVAVRAVDRVLVGTAKIVGQRAADLSLGRLPAVVDRDDDGILAVHRRREVSDDLELEEREEAKERERRVEVDVERVVEGIVEALEQGESADPTVALVGPDRPAVDEVVQL